MHHQICVLRALRWDQRAVQISLLSDRYGSLTLMLFHKGAILSGERKHNVVFLSAVVESGHVKGSMGLAMRTNVSVKKCGGQGMLDITLGRVTF